MVNIHDPTLPLPNLVDLVARPVIEPGNEEMLAVAFFDLVGSTDRKELEGHGAGVLAVRVHNATCRNIVEIFDGTVIKELGDGILVTFPRLESSVLASENFRIALRDHAATKLETRIGIASGPVEHAMIDGRDDVVGATVDRAAKVQSICAPNQIALDSATGQAVNSHVAEHATLRLVGPRPVSAPGLRGTGVYILHSERFPEVTDTPMNRFQWYEDGRLDPDEKAAYISNAREEVVEIGTTMETWASYFEELKPSLYKQHVFDRIADGVVVRVYVLDPDCAIVGPYFAGSPDSSTRASIYRSLRRLVRIKTEIDSMNLKGGWEIYTYTGTPFSYISAIDIGEVGQSAPRGRILTSPYLHGLKHAQNPMIHFTAHGNPTGFEVYRQSIRLLMNEARSFDPRRLDSSHRYGPNDVVRRLFSRKRSALQ